MDLTNWEVVEYKTPPCTDEWGSACYTPEEATPLLPMSIPFLSLPRELRDKIYRYLLSIKYIRWIYRAAREVSRIRFVDAALLT